MNPEMEREGSLRWTRRTGQCHDVRFPPLNRVLLLGLVHSLAGGESGPRAEPTCCAPAGHARLRGGSASPGQTWNSGRRCLRPRSGSRLGRERIRGPHSRGALGAGAARTRVELKHRGCRTWRREWRGFHSRSYSNLPGPEQGRSDPAKF